MEKKLRQEVKVLETRIAEIDANVEKQKKKIRVAHRENAQDVTTKKLMFGQLKTLRKQSARFSRLHQICSSMLEHVQEQMTISETSHVLQDFVHVHESLIKESNLEKLVTQYQELASNVDEMRADLGYINEALTGGDHDDEAELEEELEMFLRDDAPAPAPAPAIDMNTTPPVNQEIASRGDVADVAVAEVLPAVPETVAAEVEATPAVRPVAAYFVETAM